MYKTALIKIFVTILTVFLQSCVFSLGVGYAPEYSGLIDDNSASSVVGTVEIKKKLYSRKSGSLYVGATHISSVYSNSDNTGQNGIGGINIVGVHMEFGE